MMKTKTKLEL